MLANADNVTRCEQPFPERFVHMVALLMNQPNSENMSISRIAGAIGKGLLAGLAGTAAMTVSSTVEMKLRGRGSSDVPAQAAARVLGIEPKSEEDKERFSNIVHWGYGTGWGTVRGLISETGVGNSAATVLHFAAVWGTALNMLPALDAAPPPRKWGAQEIIIDGIHHGVYAAATGAAYTFIERH